MKDKLIQHGNTNQKKAGIALLMSGKQTLDNPLPVWAKIIIHNKQSINQEDLTILSNFISNNSSKIYLIIALSNLSAAAERCCRQAKAQQEWSVDQWGNVQGSDTPQKRLRLSYFSIAEIKHHDQRKCGENETYLSSHGAETWQPCGPPEEQAGLLTTESAPWCPVMCVLERRASPWKGRALAAKPQPHSSALRKLLILVLLFLLT